VQLPYEYLVKARSLLTAGGRVFMTTGDLESWNARLRGAAWRQIHPPTHLHYFSRKTLRALLARAGFEVLGVESAAYYHALYNVPGTLVVRGGRTGKVARGVLRAIGEPTARRFGLWLNLGDIMFVAARRNDFH
jgi:Methyltransferase domain